ncbi:hypothetical protein LguiB_010533 [Lonicera macranthoides]
MDATVRSKAGLSISLSPALGSYSAKAFLLFLWHSSNATLIGIYDPTYLKGTDRREEINTTLFAPSYFDSSTTYFPRK